MVFGWRLATLTSAFSIQVVSTRISLCTPGPGIELDIFYGRAFGLYDGPVWPNCVVYYTYIPNLLISRTGFLPILGVSPVLPSCFVGLSEV